MKLYQDLSRSFSYHQWIQKNMNLVPNYKYVQDLSNLRVFSCWSHNKVVIFLPHNQTMMMMMMIMSWRSRSHDHWDCHVWWLSSFSRSKQKRLGKRSNSIGSKCFGKLTSQLIKLLYSSQNRQQVFKTKISLLSICHEEWRRCLFSSSNTWEVNDKIYILVVTKTSSHAITSSRWSQNKNSFILAKFQFTTKGFVPYFPKNLGKKNFKILYFNNWTSLVTMILLNFKIQWSQASQCSRVVKKVKDGLGLGSHHFGWNTFTAGLRKVYEKVPLLIEPLIYLVSLLFGVAR